jgi:hypothetical protein
MSEKESGGEPQPKRTRRPRVPAEQQPAGSSDPSAVIKKPENTDAAEPAEKKSTRGRKPRAAAAELDPMLSFDEDDAFMRARELELQAEREKEKAAKEAIPEPAEAEDSGDDGGDDESESEAEKESPAQNTPAVAENPAPALSENRGGNNPYYERRPNRERELCRVIEMRDLCRVIEVRDPCRVIEMHLADSLSTRGSKPSRGNTNPTRGSRDKTTLSALKEDHNIPSSHRSLPTSLRQT